ncbi:MAG: helix-turn-helix domain-containing protein [Cocleimonas sp.]
MTNKAIALELGERIEQLRLEQNLTQQQLADEIGLSRVSYRNLVKGSGKLENFIAVLRVLDQLAPLENLIPETGFSPMQQLKYRGKQRKRASKTRKDEVREPKPFDRFDFYKDSNNEWRWRRTAKNGQIIGASVEGFKNRSSCIENAKQNGWQSALDLGW